MNRRSPKSSAASRGFTLIELMISIALVLLIILGVNTVFSMTSRTIGAGQALSSITRDNRATQTVFYTDLASAEIDNAPFFMIRSHATAAFRNRADMAADLNYSSTDTTVATVDAQILSFDADGNGVEEPTPRAYQTNRTHRVDQIFFFARGTFQRQTGSGTDLVSQMSSREAMISYGHLRQPDSTLTLVNGKDPGMRPDTGTAMNAVTNPNNFYASQWVLGRNVVLLCEPTGEPAINPSKWVIRDSSNNAVSYIGREQNATAEKMPPLSEDAQATSNGVDFISAEKLQYSICDVAGTTIEGYRSRMPAIIAAPGDWYEFFRFRFVGLPYPSRPLEREGIARTVPCLLPACTQFIVEYAGDFLDQATNGNVNGAANNSGGGTDLQIDFVVDNTSGSPVRRTRWYGYPRDTGSALNTPAAGAPDGKIEKNYDVVPLRDLAGANQPCERGSVPLQRPDYGIATGVAMSSQYLCAWSTDTGKYPRPKMLRFVIAVDDPTGRLETEQYFEYVVTLP